MNLPRFSVIIPVFNGEAFLGRAIESVLEQTWAAHEVIVVDDGSTDGSAAVAKRFGPPVRYVRQLNAGVSAARNLGGRLATGDWLAFLDADDWYYPHRLRLHAEWIAEDPALDFLTGDYDYVAADGRSMGRSMERHASGLRLLAMSAGAGRVVMAGDDDYESFAASHFGDTHTLSVPRATFVALGGYPKGLRICEDVYFLMRLLANSQRVGVVCDPLAAYLVHEASATRRDPIRAQFDNVTTLEAMLREARAWPAPVRRGVVARVRQGRLDLGYALSRVGHRLAALGAVLPNLRHSPKAIRDVLSVAIG